MNVEPALLGLAIHILIWDKAPEWPWFQRLLGFLPKPLQWLYDGWKCAYCGGFWIALSLHGITGIWTLPALANLPGYLDPAGPFMGWFLDGLATATLILAGALLKKALVGPIVRGEILKTEWKATPRDDASEGQLAG